MTMTAPIDQMVPGASKGPVGPVPKYARRAQTWGPQSGRSKGCDAGGSFAWSRVVEGTFLTTALVERWQSLKKLRVLQAGRAITRNATWAASA